ncbi:hypothetical protein [Sphingomonas sp.]|uniref:hypothetical protein n=1 Tax=Sphingomonas sp. TaxID=28214 RepID=UPI001EC23FCC|nr:hypothetical protein [Sphingomonas sp.]MBX3593420.1 hypothetical protein [Sphingomonas sp.]
MLPMYVTAITMLLAGASASVAPQEAESAKVIDQIAQCRSIADAAQRLACFDGAAAALQTARDRREIVVLDREAVKQTRRRLFGIALPKIKLFGGSDDDDEKEEIREIDAKIVSARPIANGRWVIKLDDGSTWQTIEPFASAEPKAGDSMHIKRAALGSFMGSVNGLRSARIRRTD